MARLADKLGKRAPRRVSGRWLGQRLAAAAAVVAVVVVSLDFSSFVDRVTEARPVPGASADAIVVLTGGADRIKDAAALLDSGKAARLLITGVHPDTTVKQIALTANIDPALLSCCVDLDFIAVNTLGNAEQAKLWAERRKFGSLIVVTSAYHMPRSLVEFGHMMPQVALVPHPVIRDELDLERWYVKPSLVRLVAAEYFKYLVARFRISLHAPAYGATRVADAI